MSDRANAPVRVALLALLALFLWAGEAAAYVGGAPGPEFLGYFLSLVAWLGLAFSAFLLWPVHALLRRFRRREEPAGEPADAAQGPAAPSSTTSGFPTAGR